jgi:hypothetical protein
MVVIAVMEWLRMIAFEIETIVEFQKMVIPPRVSAACRKTKSLRVAPAI